MSQHVTRRTRCRLCGSERLSLALSLTPTPPANAYVTADEVTTPQEVFPLEVFFCESCTHVQLLDIVDPSILFSTYLYVSGTSPVFVRHFEQYSDDVVKLVGPLDGRLVVDIGSNDGTLLRAFKDRHRAKGLGIDPARNLAEAATAAGIETVCGFFSPELARAFVSQHGSAAVVTANNVFAHIDDLSAVLQGVKTSLLPDGAFVFEVSYLLDLVQQTLFDTIYHEHLSYHAVRPLVPFLQNNGFELIEAVRVSSHGGSLRCIVQHTGGPRPVGRSVAAALAAEKDAGLDRLGTYTELASRINAIGHEMKRLLKDIKGGGKAIAGFGAPAKATTLMYHFGIGKESIDFIIDDSPLKQGTFTPGMHIPILSVRALDEFKPDYLVILAWNFAEAIIAKNKPFLSRGGRFIVPFPRIQVVEQ